MPQLCNDVECTPCRKRLANNIDAALTDWRVIENLHYESDPGNQRCALMNVATDLFWHAMNGMTRREKVRAMRGLGAVLFDAIDREG